jgi:hypothetical protein
LLSIVFTLHLPAQKKQYFKINSITRDNGALAQSIYKYEKFSDGDIVFKREPVANGLLNYNYLSGKIEFITSKGEILELARPETINYIALNADSFFYTKKNYAEKVSHYPGINVYKVEAIKFNGREKKGAYGTYVTTSAASSISSVTELTPQQNLAIDENTIYVTSYIFYLSEDSKNFYPASKKNFYKMFPGKEELIGKYLKNKKMNFNNAEDLVALLASLYP